MRGSSRRVVSRKTASGEIPCRARTASVGSSGGARNAASTPPRTWRTRAAAPGCRSSNSPRLNALRTRIVEARATDRRSSATWAGSSARRPSRSAPAHPRPEKPSLQDGRGVVDEHEWHSRQTCREPGSRGRLVAEEDVELEPQLPRGASRRERVGERLRQTVAAQDAQHVDSGLDRPCDVAGLLRHERRHRVASGSERASSVGRNPRRAPDRVRRPLVAGDQDAHLRPRSRPR